MTDDMIVERRDGLAAVLAYEYDAKFCNPREFDDRLCTMACWHDRRNLGDEQWSRHDGSIPDKIADLKRRQHIRGPEQVVFLAPLGYYEHGQSCIWVGNPDQGPPGTNCRWDSGQVGVVWVTRAQVTAAMGWKMLTKRRLREIERMVKSEVDEYSLWQNGEVYIADIKTEDGTVLESCGGLIGYDYAAQEAKRMLADELARIERKRIETMEAQDNG